MRITSFDDRQFRAKLARLSRGTPDARREACREMLAEVVGRFFHRIPRDTNRAASAWSDATRAVGVARFVAPPIRKSNYYAVYLERLEAQAARWRTRRDDARYRRDYLYPKGPPARGGGLYRKLTKQIERDDKTLQRAIEEIDKLRKGIGVQIRGFVHSGQAQKGRRLVTVIDKVYGGTGRFIESPQASFIQVTIREPHWKFALERRGAYWSSSVASVRAAGVKQIQKKLAQRLAQSAGLAAVA